MTTTGSDYPRAKELQGKTVVIKFGGSSIGGANDQGRFSRDIALLVSIGIRPVIVHGGGPEITEEMKKNGLQVRKVLGLRVTDDNTLMVAKTVLGRINDSLVSSIRSAGVKAIGLAGSECGTIMCRKMDLVKGVENGVEIVADPGHVGEVVSVDPRSIEWLVSLGFVPVIYSICADQEGHLYNVNADTAAAHVAKAMKAAEFILVTDVPGLMREFGNLDSVIREIRTDEVANLVADGIVKEGMIPKLEACCLAVSNGGTANIICGKDPEAIVAQLLVGENRGTRIKP
ncbi:MAG: acetylglutamate kinase [Methanomassiliicoccales archaeon]|jgi:acetylglutamate kinase